MAIDQLLSIIAELEITAAGHIMAARKPPIAVVAPT